MMVSSGLYSLIIKASYIVSIVFFIRMLFFVFREARKKRYSSRQTLPRMSKYLALCLVFLFVPYALHYVGPFPDPEFPLPCCSARSIIYDTSYDKAAGQDTAVRTGIHSAALCGCRMCYDKRMFKPKPKLENLFDREVLAEGKEYILANLYPAGSNIADFETGLSSIGLQRVKNFCGTSTAHNKVSAFKILLPESGWLSDHDRLWFLTAHYDANGKIIKTGIDRYHSVVRYNTPKESLIELASQNEIGAQQTLLRQYFIKDAYQFYFWTEVHRLHYRYIMAGAVEPTRQVSIKKRLKNIFNPSKKRPSDMTAEEWVATNLSPSDMKKASDEAQVWWNAHKHLEFCVMSDFSPNLVAREFSETALEAEKGDAAAQYALAKMYLQGEKGIFSQNRVRATKWLSRAAAQGHELSAALMEKEGLTPIKE